MPNKTAFKMKINSTLIWNIICDVKSSFLYACFEKNRIYYGMAQASRLSSRLSVTFLLGQLLLYYLTEFLQTYNIDCLWCLVVHEVEINSNCLIQFGVIFHFPLLYFDFNSCSDNSSFTTQWNFFELPWMVAYDEQRGITPKLMKQV